MKFSLYVVNLGKYNSGLPTGEWIDLPVDKDKLDEIISHVTNNGENDYEILDYETPLRNLKINQFESLSDMNKLASELRNLSKDEIVIFDCALHTLGSDRYYRSKILDCIFDNDYRIDDSIQSFVDLGYQYVEESLGLDVGSSRLWPLSGNIDYEGIGKDLVQHSELTSMIIEGIGFVELYSSI